jgi:hypothetical protein
MQKSGYSNFVNAGDTLLQGILILVAIDKNLHNNAVTFLPLTIDT